MKRRNRYGDWEEDNGPKDARAPTPGKRTVVESEYGAGRLFRKARPGKRTRTMQMLAKRGELKGRIPARAQRAPEEMPREAEQALEDAGNDPGEPLPPTKKEELSGALGQSLEDVRIHTGSASASAADTLSARAFTRGQDIHFGAGEYRPGTKEGDRLIAHEVAHTVQQRKAPAGPQRKDRVSSPQDSAEREADRFADAFVERRNQARVGLTSTEPRGALHRAPLSEVAESEPTQSPAVTGFVDAARAELASAAAAMDALNVSAQHWCDALAVQELVPLKAAGRAMLANADELHAALAAARSKLALYLGYTSSAGSGGDDYGELAEQIETLEAEARSNWRTVLIKIAWADLSALPTGELWELAVRSRLESTIDRIVDFLEALDEATAKRDLRSAGGAFLQLLGNLGSPAESVFFGQLLNARFKGQSMLPLNPELAAASDPFAGAQALSDVEVLEQQDAVRQVLAQFTGQGVGPGAASLYNDQYARLRAILAALEFTAAERNLKQDLADGETIRMRGVEWPTEPGRARAMLEKRWPVKVKEPGVADDWLPRNYFLDESVFHGAPKLAGDGSEVGHTSEGEADRLFGIYLNQYQILKTEEEQFERAFEETAEAQLRKQLDESEENARQVLAQYGMRLEKGVYYYNDSGQQNREALQQAARELLDEQKQLHALHQAHVSEIDGWLRLVRDGKRMGRSVDLPPDRLWEPTLPESFNEAVRFYMHTLVPAGFHDNLAKAEAIQELAADVRDGKFVADKAVLDRTAELEARHREIRRKTGAFHAFWLEREVEHPILASFRNSQGVGKTGKLQDIAAAEGQQMPQEIANRVAKVLKSIEETRQDVFEDGDHSIWELPRIVAQTKALMGVAPDSMRELVIDRKTEQVNDPSVLETLAIAVSLALAPFTGGSSLILAAEIGLLALDAYLAYQRIDDYNFQKAAANTDFDTLKTIAASDPSLFWVVAEIAALGVGIGVTAAAFRHARRLKQLKAAGQEDSAEALATAKKLDEISGSDEMSKKLLGEGSDDLAEARKAADASDIEPPKDPEDLLRRGKKAQQTTDALDDTASMTDPKVRDTLSRRVGAKVELDPGLGDAVVVRQSDADPENIVLRVGPEAKADDVLDQVEHVDELKKAAQTKKAEQTERVTEPVEDLYESVDPDTVPEGWKVEDIPKTDPSGVIRITTQIEAPNGATGHLIREFDPNTGTLAMKSASFHEDLPRWISAGKPLKPSKGGTPTFAYMQMRQMRKLGITRSSLKKVEMNTILNVRTVLELHELRKAGVPLDQAILETHSVKYADTALVQSGHRIRKATVSGGAEFRLDTLLGDEIGDPATRAANDELLEEYGLTRDDEVFMGFDIDLELMPWE